MATFQISRDDEREGITIDIRPEGHGSRPNACGDAGTITISAVEHQAVEHNDRLMLAVGPNVRDEVVKLRSLDQGKQIRQGVKAGHRHHDSARVLLSRIAVIGGNVAHAAAPEASPWPLWRRDALMGSMPVARSRSIKTRRATRKSWSSPCQR